MCLDYLVFSILENVICILFVCYAGFHLNLSVAGFEVVNLFGYTDLLVSVITISQLFDFKIEVQELTL